MMVTEFRGFLTKTNAVALAIGVIIGTAIAGVVSALVADIFMPLLGLFLPGGDWRQARLVLSTSTDASGKITENAILYGHFLGALVDFVLISFVLFLIIRTLVKPAPAPEVEPTRQCPECLEVLPAAARRCRACTGLLV